MFKKRIFVGSFITIDNRELYTRIKKDFGGITAGRWVPEKNLHITYRFIGDVDLNELKNIYSALNKEINHTRSVNIQLKGVSAFPDIYNPRIFFIKVQDEDGYLEDINRSIQEKLSVLGYEKETRPFIPHITIKRLKGVKKGDFIKKVKEYEDVMFSTQKSLEVNIIESTLTPKGAIYKKILL
ncbi:RNA 2',3'-cyclic phosphodiesterase [Persephonella sp.]